MKTLITVLLLVISTFCFSQTQYNVMDDYGNIEAAQGTYQLMTTEPKVRELFTTHLLYFIEESRAPNETIIKKVGEYTYVRILPKSYISLPNYTRLSDEIIAIDYDEIIE